MKISRPVLYGGIGVIGLAAWFLTGEDAPAKNTVAKPKPTVSKKLKGVVFLKEDYENRYARLNDPVRNAFKPIVARQFGANVELLAPNAIPADFAGGDPNWVYTGMATVDGVAMGLVENGSTLDGEFIKINQKWKRARVLKITPESLTLESERGVVRTMRLKNQDDFFEQPENSGGLIPINPLQGPIGGEGVAVRPESLGQGNVVSPPSTARPSSTPSESNHEN